MGEDGKPAKKAASTWEELVGELVMWGFMIGIMAGLYFGLGWAKEKINYYRKTTPEQREAIEAAEQRAAWEKECADKGLRFKGTIGGQVECRP